MMLSYIRKREEKEKLKKIFWVMWVLIREPEAYNREAAGCLDQNVRGPKEDSEQGRCFPGSRKLYLKGHYTTFRVCKYKLWSLTFLE